MAGHKVLVRKAKNAGNFKEDRRADMLIL